MVGMTETLTGYQKQRVQASATTSAKPDRAPNFSHDTRCQRGTRRKAHARDFVAESLERDNMLGAFAQHEERRHHSVLSDDYVRQILGPQQAKVSLRFISTPVPLRAIEVRRSNDSYGRVSQHLLGQSDRLLFGKMLQNIVADDDVIVPARWKRCARITHVNLVVSKFPNRVSVGLEYLQTVDDKFPLGGREAFMSDIHVLTDHESVGAHTHPDIKNSLRLHRSNKMEDGREMPWITKRHNFCD